MYWYFIVALIFISQSPGDVANHFMGLFSICVFSPVKSRFIFLAYIFSQVFWSLRIIHTFGIQILDLTYVLLQTFTPSLLHVFIPLTVSFETTFNFDDGQLTNLFFVNHAFCVTSKTCLCNPGAQRFSPMFSSRNFGVLGVVLSSLTYYLSMV